MSDDKEEKKEKTENLSGDILDLLNWFSSVINDLSVSKNSLTIQERCAIAGAFFAISTQMDIVSEILTEWGFIIKK